MVARVLWLAIFLLTLVMFCANLLVGRYGLVTTILLMANCTVWFAGGLVLFWRKSTDPAVLLFSLQLVLTGGYFFPPLPLALRSYGAWWVPVDVLGILAGIALTVVYTFPDGRFVPGFSRWLAVGWIAVSLLPVLVLGGYDPWHWWLSPLYTLLRLVFYVSLGLALVYRYRRNAAPVQRQQIKWVVFAAAVVITEVTVANLILSGLSSYFPVLTLSPELHHPISALAFYVLPVLLPLSVMFALMRYRLWDVDRLINKVLVYGLLTGLLGACYMGLVIGLESLAGVIMGTADQPIALVISTLVIAALFTPLRRWLQALIDRRLYRRKYDAAKTLTAFGATLRTETDLDALSQHLVSVVRETMQPVSVSLWLRLPDREVRR